MADRSVSRQVDALVTVPAITAVVVSASLLGWLVLRAPRGLDLMDESYVLRLLAAPEESKYAGEVFLFPFLVHPVFELLGRDVGALRALTAVVLALTAGATALAVARVVTVNRSRLTWVAVAAVAAAAATPVLTLGVRVPGYRVVALLGLLLLVWGVAKVVCGDPVSGGVLAGLGAWVTFAGKPTSAVAAAVLLAACAVPLGLWRVKVVAGAASGLVAGAVGTLLVAGLTPLGAVGYLQDGLTTVNLLGAYPSRLAMLGLQQPVVPVLPLLFGTPLLLVGIAGLIGVGRPSTRRQRGYWALATAVGLIALTIALTLLGRAVLGSRAGTLLMVELALVVAVLALVVWFEARREATTEGRGRRVTALFVLLMVCPYVLAVGSNVPLDLMIGQGVVFWVLAGVLAAAAEASAGDGTRTARLGVFLLCSASVVAVVMFVAAHRPLDGSEESGHDWRAARVLGGQLELTAHDADLARHLRALGAERGVTQATPVLDVSGVSPGYALMLGGRFLGRANLYSNFGGATRSAQHVLDQVPCTDLARAWVFYAADDPGVAAALTGRGLDLRRDYDEAFAFKVFRFGRSWDLRVLEPTERVAEVLGCHR